MISEKEILEIREHLANAQNPLFFFDNDNDGLCSMLLLRRFIERGKGVVIRSYPDLNTDYVRKIDELNPDYIFILDKPVVAPEFIAEIKKRNIPLVWIDHHDIEIDEKVLEGIFYYNSKFEPVTYICWKIADKKDDMWLALIGCMSDYYVPDFADEYAEKNPELFKKIKNGFEGYYDTELGKVAQMFNFGLKDTITNVVRMIKFLFDAKGPYDVLTESKKNKMLWERYEFLNKKHKILIEKAREGVKGNLAYFEYGGDFSLSAELANEMKYRNPEKYIVIAYIDGGKVNVSLRGRDVKIMTAKFVEELENARGGGHQDATGMTLPKDELEKFKELLEREVNG